MMLPWILPCGGVSDLDFALVVLMNIQGKIHEPFVQFVLGAES